MDTPLEIHIDEQEYSSNYACKVLANITDRELDMVATHVFEQMGHKGCTKVLSDEYDLDDGNSEDDNVFADNSQNDIYELPSHIIDMTSFLISFAKCEFKVKHSTALINGINCPLEDTLRFSCQVLSLVPHSNTWAKDARIIGLPTSSSVDKWFDTGQELIIVSGYVPLLHIPSSSASYSHILSETIKKGYSCLFAKLYNWGQLGGIKLDVESFNTMYLDKCFGVPENIENQHLDKILLKYEQGLPVKELHSNKVKVRIEFIVSAKNKCEILEQAVGNQLIDARRQTKWTTVSSPAYFGCYIITKPLESLSPNNNFMWRVNLQLYSSSPAGFVVYLTFPNLPFDPGIHDIPIAIVVDLNMFTNSSVLSIYDPIATLWGDWVYSDGKSTSYVVLILAICKDAWQFRQVVASQRFGLYPYDLGPNVQLPTNYGPLGRKGTTANVVLSLQGGGVGCTFDFELLSRSKVLSAPIVAIVDSPEAASWNDVYIEIGFLVPLASGGVYLVADQKFQHVFCLFKLVTRRPRGEIVCHAHVTLDSLFHVATVRFLQKSDQEDKDATFIIQLLHLLFIPTSHREKNSNISIEVAAVLIYREVLQILSMAKMLELLQRKYARSFVVEVVLSVFHQFGWITATAYYASHIFDFVDFSRRIASIPWVVVEVLMKMLGFLVLKNVVIASNVEGVDYMDELEDFLPNVNNSEVKAGPMEAHSLLNTLSRHVPDCILPLARIAVYKTCWGFHCYNVDLLAAFNCVLRDGIHVILLSWSPDASQADYFNDVISIGPFQALSFGNLVVASDGNQGSQSFFTNLALWEFIVAASYTDIDLIPAVEDKFSLYDIVVMWLEGIPDSNLEGKVLIEDGSIVMNQAIGPRSSHRARRPSKRLIWDPGPRSARRNQLKGTKR